MGHQTDARGVLTEVGRAAWDSATGREDQASGVSFWAYLEALLGFSDSDIHRVFADAGIACSGARERLARGENLPPLGLDDAIGAAIAYAALPCNRCCVRTGDLLIGVLRSPRLGAVLTGADQAFSLLSDAETSCRWDDLFADSPEHTPAEAAREPDARATEAMLVCARSTIERDRRVMISRDAVHASVRLAARRGQGEGLGERAIGLLLMACEREGLGGHDAEAMVLSCRDRMRAAAERLETLDAELDAPRMSDLRGEIECDEHLLALIAGGPGDRVFGAQAEGAETAEGSGDPVNGGGGQGAPPVGPQDGGEGDGGDGGDGDGDGGDDDFDDSEGDTGDNSGSGDGMGSTAPGGPIAPADPGGGKGQASAQVGLSVSAFSIAIVAARIHDKAPALSAS